MLGLGIVEHRGAKETRKAVLGVGDARDLTAEMLPGRRTAELGRT
jgi:hypothetical protein